MDGMDVDDEDAAAAAVLSKSGGLANLLDELLEGDFDPEEYDRRMAEAFDDEYYEVRGWAVG
jgi:protein KRI1